MRIPKTMNTRLHPTAPTPLCIRPRHRHPPTPNTRRQKLPTLHIRAINPILRFILHPRLIEPLRIPGLHQSHNQILIKDDAATFRRVESLILDRDDEKPDAAGVAVVVATWADGDGFRDGEAVGTGHAELGGEVVFGGGLLREERGLVQRFTAFFRVGED